MGAGDGDRDFFDAGLFNVFRSPEENAAAAADRAAEAVEEAAWRNEVAGIEEEVAPPNASGVTHLRSGNGVMPVVDRNARVGQARQRKAMKAMARKIEEIERNQRRMFQAVRQRDEVVGGWLSKALAITGAIVNVVNVQDKPSNVFALQLARIVEGAVAVGWSNGSSMVKLARDALLIWAYYDSKKGLMSLFTAATTRTGSAGGLSGLLSSTSTTSSVSL